MSTGRNKYLNTVIPFFYQRQTIDIMIFTFIDTYRFLHPGVTIREAAEAFKKRHNIADHLYDEDSMIITFQRINKDLYDAQKATEKKAV